jgi:hypothetical protein
MARIEIDIDDILYDMSDYEKQELVDDLYEDGYIASKDVRSDVDGDLSEWDKGVKKLFGNAWRLSKEDEATILAITNKIVQ